APSLPRARGTWPRTSAGGGCARPARPRRTAAAPRSLGDQPEPVEAARRQRQQVRQGADLREARAAEHLLRDQPLELSQVELDGLRRARQVVHAEDDVLLVA